MQAYAPSFRPDRRGLMKAAGALAGLSLLPKGTLAAEDKQVNFYNWDTYIGETTLDDFTAATGIEVKLDLFADNDELFAKLREGNPGYDLIVPTNDFVERMLVAGILMPLDHDKIPNMSNLGANFRDASFDPGLKHSIPYMWGTIGVGYNTARTGDISKSWKHLYDSDQFAGQISLLGDGQNVIGHAMKYLGHSLNSTDIAHVKEAEELLISQKENIKVFADDNGQDLLASGEVVIAQEWNGDILQVMTEDDDISFYVPDEGGLIWQDCLCIPNDAPHPDNAHDLINYILDADAGAAIADFIQYATPNDAARAKLGPEYNENPAIFPPDETVARCEFQLYLGEEHVKNINDAWTRVQAA
ncbi:MAG: spermidine/putrescine ABC transporter substrate-binding protein [Rhodobacteraceae bacterium]|nr:spermidine/putrescine ABC transporter substrate-binding protein [Paracoccaceae bacterium]MCY4197819.1 spermidine/putrescine ABC transporter substrate-binding protein [Paracoccaceae bacterium]